MVSYGHVSDYTAPAPDQSPDFTYTSHFNRAFVVSDDNCFPYQALRQSGPASPTDSRFDWSQIQEFIVPLPEKVFLTADHARKVIETLLLHPETGIATHSPDLANRNLVLRLFLTSSRSFKHCLRARGMGSDLVATVYRNLPMPHFIWVCEIADHDEYSRERKIRGEVLWDATRNAHEPNGWIALHYPEKLLVDVGSAINLPQTIKAFPIPSADSYSLFQSNLHSL